MLVNGRIDIAVAAGANGVHLPSNGAPTSAIRRRFGQGVLIGRSTHTLEEIAEAARDGANYTTFSPIFETPGKLRYGPPAGRTALKRAVALNLAVYALGGVSLENLPQIAATGAVGVAGIRIFQPGPKLRRVVERASELFPARAQ